MNRWLYMACEIARHQGDRFYGSRNADDVCKVIEAMLYLNGLAKGRLKSQQSAIYALKHALTRKLYQQFVPTHVYRELQVLPCHACGGTGHYVNWRRGYDDPDEPCYRCEGTGVYKSIPLLRFVFVIPTAVGASRFSWHIPEALVKFPVYVEQSDLVIEGVFPGESDLDSHAVTRAFACVSTHLGVPGPTAYRPLARGRIWARLAMQHDERAKIFCGGQST